MIEFNLKGGNNFIKITLDEVFGFPENTCYWGGYDTKSILEIKSRGFQVNAILYTSTGELYEFYKKLKDCNTKLNGKIYYKSYEGSLELNLEYNEFGHVNISGIFDEQNEYNNELKFEFISDQTFITKTINELELIAEKYGGMKGIKK